MAKSIKLSPKETGQLLLLLGFFLTLPLNLFIKWQVNTAYVHGLLIDYLIPKFYLFEIFAIFFAAWVIKDNPPQWLKNWHSASWWQHHLTTPNWRLWLLASLGLAFIIRQFFTAYPWASGSMLFHLLVAGVSTWAIARQRSSIEGKFPHFFTTVFWLMLIGESCLAYLQFSLQHAIFPYWVLGESNLQTYAGISHAWFFGQERILAYGSTAHPNILAGLIVILSIFIWEIQAQRRRMRPIQLNHLTTAANYLLLANCLGILLLTQSVSASLALLLYGCYRIYQALRRHWLLNFFLPTVFIGILLFIPVILLDLSSKSSLNNDSINRRVVLNQAAFAMMEQNTWVGVGLNNFTGQLEKYQFSHEVLRFVQPVHHLVLLFLAETGLLGIAFLLLLCQPFVKNFAWEKVLPLLGIMALDHYLASQAMGWHLLGLYALFVFDLSLSQTKKASFATH